MTVVFKRKLCMDEENTTEILILITDTFGLYFTITVWLEKQDLEKTLLQIRLKHWMQGGKIILGLPTWVILERKPSIYNISPVIKEKVCESPALKKKTKKKTANSHLVLCLSGTIAWSHRVNKVTFKEEYRLFAHGTRTHRKVCLNLKNNLLF